jgi:archaellum component FlaG (FlaF/FlaG flagellin family)
MGDLASWLPLVLGGFIVVVICIRIFSDPALNNLIGYALIGAVALCAMPTIQNFKYKGSLGEVQADMKNTVATQSANLGGDINSINKKLDLIAQKLNANFAAATDPSYQKNKTREVLVFYNSPAATQAEQIRTVLLDLGYKSSATYTDFSELGSDIQVPGSIRLVHTKATENLANSIRSTLRSKFPEIKEIGDEIKDKMNSGEVQIQLF